jgi:hypothetical protein
MGYTATWAGLAVAPIGILPVLMSPFVGKYAPGSTCACWRAWRSWRSA